MINTCVLIFVLLVALVFMLTLIYAHRQRIIGAIIEPVARSNIVVDELERKKRGGSNQTHTRRFSKSQNEIIKIKDLKQNPRSKSEAQVIEHLQSLTGHSWPTVYLRWLVWKGRPLELDGYDAVTRVGLEFSGPLHTKWNPSTEPYEKYFDRIVKDIAKIRLCKKHGVKLMVVDASLPREHWRKYVASRLVDFGVLDAPTHDSPDYIPAQIAVPFRNEQIESELDLGPEMAAVMKI